jgi:hypothetical protein
MNKHEIPREDGRLKRICNSAFFGVKRILPKCIRETELYDKGLASVLGFIAGYGVAETGESVVEYLNREYRTEIPLRDIASHSLAAGAPVIAKIIAPRHFSQYVSDNPRYSPVF